MAADGGTISEPERVAVLDAEPTTRPKRLGLAIAWAAGLFAAYLGAIAVAVAAGPVLLKLAGAVAAGVVITLIAIVGHDVGHGAITRNKRVSFFLGTACFLPGLHPYGLWKYHHNIMHHGHTAQLGLDDAYPPITVADYEARGPLGKRLYEFSRTLVGQQFCYMMDVFFPKIFFPFAYKGYALKKSDWRDIAVVYAWTALFAAGALALSVAAGPGAGAFTHAANVAVFAFIIPMTVWLVSINFLAIVQHTAPQVVWRAPLGHPTPPEEMMLSTVHIELPEWADRFYLRIMQHVMHHRNVKIDLWSLKEAEARLCEERPDIIRAKWTPAYHAMITRECQLWDAENEGWTTFKAVRERLGRDAARPQALADAA